jgi:AcrR family transcriptional regulator
MLSCINMTVLRRDQRNESTSKDEAAKRPGVTAAAIAEAALAVADRRGLRGVTIRAVAKAVGLSPMALYTYFAKKDDLYDAMFDKVLDLAFERVGRSSWQLELEAGCRQARDLLRAHSEWLPLLTRVTLPATSLPLYEHLLELAAADGMSPTDVMFAASSAISFTLGTVLVERMMSRPPGTAVPALQLRLVRELLPRTGAAKWPRVAAAADSFEGWSFDGVFEHGLRSLIAGIELRVRSTRTG